MQIETLSLGPLQANCYVVSPSNTTYVIDPGGDAPVLLDFLRDQGIEPEAILLTHGHFDHIGALPEIVRHYSVPILLADNDKGLYRSADNSMLPFFPAVQGLPEVDSLETSPCEGIEVIQTPGHSPGSVCFRFGRSLFTGDTLFMQGIGRSDLPGGNGQQLLNSIKNELLALDDDVIVYPGHGGPTTIGAERRFNPFLS